MGAPKLASEGSTPYVDPTPMPEHVPKVDELGVTSGPLKSASFFIGAYCKDYNEDYMLCKNESRDPEHCLKEGRKVTRCAADLINKLRETCMKQWDDHWDCLEWNNQEFNKCRREERVFNRCVFDKLGLAKTIPGTPEGQEPIHLKKNPIYTRVQK